MTTPFLTDQLRHVVQAATLAPSIHNTQPWRFDLRPDGFDLHADPLRRLHVVDRSGRQLHLSCGAALLTARVAARGLGLDSEVELLPEPGRPELLARFRLSVGAPPDDAELALALAVLHRHTVRTPFAPEPLPDELVEELRRAAEAQGASLRPVRSGRDLVELEALLSRADTVEERDPAYRRETAAWVHEPSRGDGIPPEALPGPQARGTSLRLRDFRLAGPEPRGEQPPPVERPLVLVLSTPCDDRASWLQAGQALGAVLLHAAAHGVQAQPLGQLTDLPGWRHRLAAVLGLLGNPQLVLRAGYAQASAATPRRDLRDVLV